MKAGVAVIGAGPAGLAAACGLARRGVEVVLCEQESAPPDKACGEGVLPAGVRRLEELGVRLDDAERRPLRGVRWVLPDGTAAVGRLPEPGGLGVRRPALAAGLVAAAEDAGAELLWNCRVHAHRRGPDRVVLHTDHGEIACDLLVAADGLHSPVRRREGLLLPLPKGRRFGARRHFRVAPWHDLVDVHLGPGVEAFATPVAADTVGVALLWDADDTDRWGRRAPDFDDLERLFPRLAARLGDAPAVTPLRSAGPFEQRVSAAVRPRLVLLGDAGGYVDAVTGEGISLALREAAVLAEVAPAALAAGCTEASLLPYDRARRQLYGRYARIARLVRGLARRPRLSAPLVRRLAGRPRLVDRLVRGGLG